MTYLQTGVGSVRRVPPHLWSAWQILLISWSIHVLSWAYLGMSTWCESWAGFHLPWQDSPHSTATVLYTDNKTIWEEKYPRFNYAFVHWQQSDFGGKACIPVSPLLWENCCAWFKKSSVSHFYYSWWSIPCWFAHGSCFGISGIAIVENRGLRMQTVLLRFL